VIEGVRPTPHESSANGFLPFIGNMRRCQQTQGLGFSLLEVGESIQLREPKAAGGESVKQLLNGETDRHPGEAARTTASESELETDLRRCTRELNYRRRHAAQACPVLEEAAGVSE